MRRLSLVPASLALAGLASAQSYRISQPFPPGPDGGDVQELLVSPDGTRVVYRADAESRGIYELFSAPTDGSAAPVKLNDLLPGDGVRAHGFAISPDGARVVYIAVGDTHGYHLFSVAIDRSTPPVELSGPMSGDGVVAFLISADGARVAYAADQTTWHQFELFGAPIDGSSSWTRLSGTLPSFASVHGQLAAAERIVYSADVVAYGRTDLFSVRFDGSSAPLQLTHVPSSSRVTQFQATADGARVVYEQLRTSPTQEISLWSVASDGSGLPLPLGAGQFADLVNFRISADGARAVLCARASVPGPLELFSVPLDASAAAVRLHPALASDRNVLADTYAITADSARVVYVADQDAHELFELWSAPIDGSSAPVKLNRALVSGGDVVSAHGVARVNAAERVVYVADQDTDGVLELYAVPANGSAAALQLSGSLVSASVHPYSTDPLVPTEPFGADHARVVFALDTSSGSDTVTELFAVPIDASSAPVKLSGALVAGGDVFPDGGWAFVGGHVLYLADGNNDEQRELYNAPLDGSSGPLALDDGMVAGPPWSHVNVGFEVTADDARVVYQVQGFPSSSGIFSAPPDGSAPPVALLDGVAWNDELSFQLTADGARALISWVTFPSATRTLWSGPSDGSAPPLLLFSGPLGTGGFLGTVPLARDGQHAVLRSNEQLFRVTLDGSTPPLALTTAPPAGQILIQYEISPDSRSVVFLQDRDGTGKIELYSVPPDGSAAPLRLNQTLQTNGDVERFAIGPHGALVVFSADAEVDYQTELYVVPIAGGTVRKLNGPLVSGGDVQTFLIGPDSKHVAYVADQEVSFRYELYCAPMAGGSAVKLNGPLVPGGDVSWFSGTDTPQFTPDGKRVLYVADQDTDDELELYSALATGGGATKLNGPLGPGERVTLPRVSPNSRFVCYRVGPVDDPGHELFCSRVALSAVPRRLGGSFPAGASVGDFAFTPDSRQVLYVANQDTRYSSELYSVPIHGGERTKLDGPLVPRGDVIAFAITPDSRRVVYQANQAIEQVYELFGSELERSHARRAR